MTSSRRDFSWVDRYIFPGGQLPSLRAISRIVRSSTTLEITETRRLSDSYAQTLREWRHRFTEALPTVKTLGFDERFCRLWNLYLSYFEASFRARYCNVWQIGMRKRA
ncbi:Mycolic acid cyclopropane synthetase [Lentzea albidocapillata subsp. violacea]|uniref:Mycolic acid cyclopropane synthetase n=1 Tax=Lentzea albidocapillata subsp. violacea TaxID=128104 RepID=A0A1G9R106_9PSEU|nr:Mycolic acid cyclopropane synthetase [Lentzea albidocapillata subsp. violacea]